MVNKEFKATRKITIEQEFMVVGGTKAEVMAQIPALNIPEDVMANAKVKIELKKTGKTFEIPKPEVAAAVEAAVAPVTMAELAPTVVEEVKVEEVKPQPKTAAIKVAKKPAVKAEVKAPKFKNRPGLAVA